MELPPRAKGTSGKSLGISIIYNIPQVIKVKSFPKSAGVFLFTLLHFGLEDATVSKQTTILREKKKKKRFSRCETKL